MSTVFDNYPREPESGASATQDGQCNARLHLSKKDAEALGVPAGTNMAWGLRAALPQLALDEWYFAGKTPSRKNAEVATWDDSRRDTFLEWYRRLVKRSTRSAFADIVGVTAYKHAPENTLMAEFLAWPEHPMSQGAERERVVHSALCSLFAWRELLIFFQLATEIACRRRELQIYKYKFPALKKYEAKALKVEDAADSKSGRAVGSVFLDTLAFAKNDSSPAADDFSLAELKLVISESLDGRDSAGRFSDIAAVAFELLQRFPRVHGSGRASLTPQATCQA